MRTIYERSLIKFHETLPLTQTYGTRELLKKCFMFIVWYIADVFRLIQDQRFSLPNRTHPTITLETGL
jgi:hypothetical protein